MLNLRRRFRINTKIISMIESSHRDLFLKYLFGKGVPSSWKLPIWWFIRKISAHGKSLSIRYSKKCSLKIGICSTVIPSWKKKLSVQRTNTIFVGNCYLFDEQNRKGDAYWKNAMKLKDVPWENCDPLMLNSKHSKPTSLIEFPWWWISEYHDRFPKFR